MENQHIYFLSFGGPSQPYHDALERICNQAKSFNMFNKIFPVTEQTLIEDKNFWDKHGSFINSNRRGYGYWLWKPYIITKILSHIEENSILLYCDCGCELNIDGLERFKELIKLTNNKLILGTNGGSTDYNYTKMDLIKFFDYDISSEKEQEILKQGHMQAGILMMKNCKVIKNLVKIWYDICSSNYHFIDDSLSININTNEFIEHRHDMSVFNLLVKKMGLINYDIDPSYFGTMNEVRRYMIEGKKQPIWCTRNISKISIKN